MVFFLIKISLAFIWGIIYFCTMDGFFRIFEKTSSELIWARLYTKVLQNWMIKNLRISLERIFPNLLFNQSYCFNKIKKNKIYHKMLNGMKLKLSTWLSLFFRGRSQTTLTSFWLFWPPTPLTFSTLYTLKKKSTFFDYLPPSSCKLSLWATP